MLAHYVVKSCGVWLRVKVGKAACCSGGVSAMTQMQFVPYPSGDSFEPRKLYQQRVLERAVAKLVVYGQRVGISTDEMIQMLAAGLTVGELLEYVLSRRDVV